MATLVQPLSVAEDTINLDEEELWRQEAICRGAPSELFFPKKGEVRKIRAVKEKYCRQCPVRMDCLKYAVRMGSIGIFGGTTEDERRLMHLIKPEMFR